MKCSWKFRANRAQYAEVSWRSAAEVEMAVVSGTALPTMQGTDEEEGEGWHL